MANIHSIVCDIYWRKRNDKKKFLDSFFSAWLSDAHFFNKVLCNWKNDAVVKWITPLYTHIWSRVWAKSLLVVRRICNENKRVNAKPKAIFVNKRVQSNDRLIKRNMIFHNEREKKKSQKNLSECNCLFELQHFEKHIRCTSWLRFVENFNLEKHQIILI